MHHTQTLYMLHRPHIAYNPYLYNTHLIHICFTHIYGTLTCTTRAHTPYIHTYPTTHLYVPTHHVHMLHRSVPGKAYTWDKHTHSYSRYPQALSPLDPHLTALRMGVSRFWSCFGKENKATVSHPLPAGLLLCLLRKAGPPQPSET